MTAGNWFWVIYFLVGVLGGGYGFGSTIDRKWMGFGFVGFVLLGLLGWGIFGPPIK